MRDVERSIRVFFAGTCNDSSYTTQFRFNILTRSAIFRFVNQNFDVVNLAQSGPRSGIVVSVTERPDQDMMKHTLRLDEYLEVVARSDFFLCMPGFRIPHSHNLIEAMSVGSIPILNYTAYVQPRLAPGRDCLAFNSLDELATVLNRALSMTEDEIVTMRTHVTDFYDRELDPTAFARRVLALDPDVNTLLVNDESGA